MVSKKPVLRAPHFNRSILRTPNFVKCFSSGQLGAPCGVKTVALSFQHISLQRILQLLTSCQGGFYLSLRFPTRGSGHHHYFVSFIFFIMSTANINSLSARARDRFFVNPVLDFDGFGDEKLDDEALGAHVKSELLAYKVEAKKKKELESTHVLPSFVFEGMNTSWFQPSSDPSPPRLELLLSTIEEQDFAAGLSVYTGKLGLVLMYMRLHDTFCNETTGQRPDCCYYLLQAHANVVYYRERYQQKPSRFRASPSFHTGPMGLFGLAVAVGARAGDDDMVEWGLSSCLSYAQQALTSVEFAYDEETGAITDNKTEILYGRAGLLFTLLFLKRQMLLFPSAFSSLASSIPNNTPPPPPFSSSSSSSSSALPSGLGVDTLIKQTVNEVCDACSAVANEAGHPNIYLSIWHGTRYLGGAHGISGILHLFLQAEVAVEGGVLEGKQVETIVRTLEFLRSECRVTTSGNYLNAHRDDPKKENDYLVHWCHGAPAVAMLFAVAFQVLKQERFRDWALEASQVVWERGLLRKGAALCHGMTGSAYVFLALHRALGGTSSKEGRVQLRRAQFFAGVVSQILPLAEHELCSFSDDWYSLYTGLAGIVCLLADLQRPSLSRFPGFDVFL